MNDPSSILYLKAWLFGVLLSWGGLSMAQPVVPVTAVPDGSPSRQLVDWKSPDDGFGAQRSNSGHLMPRGFVLQDGRGLDK